MAGWDDGGAPFCKVPIIGAQARAEHKNQGGDLRRYRHKLPCLFTGARQQEQCRGYTFAIRPGRLLKKDVRMEIGASVCRILNGFPQLSSVHTSGDRRKTPWTTGTGGSVCDPYGSCSRMAGARKQGEAFAKPVTVAAADDTDGVTSKPVPWAYIAHL